MFTDEGLFLICPIVPQTRLENRSFSLAHKTKFLSSFAKIPDHTNTTTVASYNSEGCVCRACM